MRLYGDGIFPTDVDRAETFGHDLLTGATIGPTNYRAMRVDGRAILKAAAYNPPHETPSDQYPLQYSTGRTVYQFHTRTKTGRARQLQKAAPSAWVELSRVDAEARGIQEGDLVRVRSARGEIVVPARIGQVREGCVLAPFHYGYWEDGRSGPDGRPTAANELTMTEWDPVSKQPIFKVAAVQIEKIADATGPAPAPTTTASRPVDPSRVPATVGGPDGEAQESLRPVEPPRIATREEA